MNKCPRWGWVELSTRNRSYVKETICKTWSCMVCRNKLINMVKMRMEYGCLKVGLSWLITLTLKPGEGRTLKDARYVKTAWTALLRSLKKRSPNLSWIRVIEATKKGIPHLHLLVGGLSTTRIAACVSDKSKRIYTRKWFRMNCRSDCLMHEWAHVWSDVTDSFNVDVKEVYGVKGAVGYLAKYLIKGFLDRERLVELGFERRWSCSRNWPRETQIRLRGTLEEKSR